MKTKDLIVALFFMTVSALIFLPMFISDKLFTWLDFTYYFMPFRELVSENVRNGVMPLWNPYIYCGNPLMANMQSAVFYPLNVLYYVLPFAAAVKIQTMLAFFIASFSMYALARSYRATRLASILAGSVFAFGFYMTVRAPEMADLHTIIWIPAILLLARRHALYGKLFDLFLLSLCLSMSFLGGHPQVFSYAFILFTVFYFFEAAGAGNRLAASAIKYAAACGILFFTVLMQLLPSAEFVLLSKRAAEGVGANVHLSTFAGWGQAIAFFFPFVAQGMNRPEGFLNWMALIDMGAPAIILFTAGIFVIKKSRVKTFLYVVFTAAAVIAFAGNFGFYREFLKVFPALGAVEYVSKINIICLVTACLLAAFSFDEFFGEGPGHKRTAFVLAALACAAIAVWIIVSAMKGKPVKDAGIYVMYFSIFAALAAARHLEAGIKRTASFAALAAVIAALFSYHTAGYDTYSASWSFTEDTENIKALKSMPDAGSARLLAPPPYNRFDYSVKTSNNEAAVYFIRDSLFPNTPMAIRMMNADGFDSLEIGSFYELKKRIQSFDNPWDNPAFRLLSAGYVASQREIKNAHMKLVSKGMTNLYKYDMAVPRAYFFSGPPVYTDDKNEILAGVTAPEFNPLVRLYLELRAKENRALLAVPGKNDGKTELSFVNINEPVIITDAAMDGMMVISDNYYPGWEATVNGVKTRIYRANHTFKAIPVKKGKNEIRLIFDPVGVKIGLAVSVLSVFLILLVAVCYIIKKRKYAQKVS